MKELITDEIFKNVHDFRLLCVVIASADPSGTLQTTFRRLQESLEYLDNRQRKQPSKSVINRSLEHLEQKGFIQTERTEQGTLIKLLKFFGNQKSSDLKNYERTEVRTLKTEKVVNTTNIFDKFYLSYGKQPTPLQIQQLFSFHELDGLDIEVISKAIERASTVSGHFNYLTTILKNWHKEGVKRPEDVERVLEQKGREGNEINEGRYKINHEKYDFGF